MEIKNKSFGHFAQINDLLFEFVPMRFRMLDTSINNERTAQTHYSQILHSHLHAEVFACKSKNISIKTADKVYSLKKGDIAIIPLGIPHSKLKSDDTSVEWNSVGVVCSRCKTKVNTDLYSAVSHLLCGNEIVVIESEPRLSSLLHKIGETPQSEGFDVAHLNVAVELCRIAAERDAASKSCQERSKLTAFDSDRLIKIDTIINGYYMLNFSAKQLASELYLSERQLSRIINRYYGVPLHTLILNRRIEAAASMLTETDISVESIAASVGFNGKVGFYREFRKAYGKTPLQYRKANKNDRPN